MQKEIGEKIGESFSMWIILKKIAFLNISKPIIISKLAERIDMLPTNPYFRNVFFFLKENKAIIEEERIGAYILVKIDNKKAHQLLRNTRIFKEVEDSIHKIRGGFAIT